MSCKEGSYKRLGDYIREVDVRNRDMQCTNLLGLSIAKVFIPSIANTVGTDFRSYKIVKHNQFAYVPVTSRNGEKITVALYDGQEDCIISQAYTSFEIKDTSELLPEYLMMWFRRPEFDRYARFKSHGSAREVFDWEEMCNVMMPIPDPTEQQSIVNQYNAIQKRIENNKQTIAKLEEAAQAIYRKMFVDDIDPENLPEGWENLTIGDIAKVSAGGDRPAAFSETKSKVFSVPIYSNGTDNFGLYGYTTVAKIKEPSVTVSARGTIGYVCLREEPYVPIVRLLVFVPKKIISHSAIYLYFLLRNLRLEGDGAVQLQLTAPKVKEVPIVVPLQKSINDFSILTSRIYSHINNLRKENECLIKMIV